MTIIASIVERFAMELEEPAPGHDEWFLDWVIRSPKNAGHHLTAGWMALNSLDGLYKPEDINSCVEYFGGMGAQALMVRELFDPRPHAVIDFSHDAARHLRKVLPASIGTGRGDAYDPSNCVPADLVMLDFGDLTVWKTREGEKHRRLLDRVFAHRPKAVVLTDIACRYLHLHRERYETLLGAGSCVDYETYLHHLCVRIRKLYGYSLQEGYFDRWSTVMAFVPEGMSTSAMLLPTPDSPVGLELL